MPLVSILCKKLESLYADELSDVGRYIEKIESARGAASDPDLCALILAELIRLAPLYRFGDGVPIARLRVHFSERPRANLRRALLDLEQRGLVRLLPTELRRPFVDRNEGIPSARGLLYFVTSASEA